MLLRYDTKSDRNVPAKNPFMNINQVREHLHRLIDEVDDIYVLNGLYRNLVADKRQREEYEQEQARADNREKNQKDSRSKRG